METPGWTDTGFDASAWGGVAAVPPPSSSVIVSSHAVMPVIRVTESYSPVNMYAFVCFASVTNRAASTHHSRAFGFGRYESSPGVWVYDFGQNLAGFVTLRIPEGLDTAPGTNVSMLHAEAVTASLLRHDCAPAEPARLISVTHTACLSLRSTVRHRRPSITTTRTQPRSSPTNHQRHFDACNCGARFASVAKRRIIGAQANYEMATVRG